MDQQTINLRKTEIGVFFLQVSSTIPFSVLLSSLILYFSYELNFSIAKSSAVMGSFFAMIFGLQLLSGALAGKIITNRHLYLAGTIINIISFFLFMLNQPDLLFVALALFMTGGGLLLTCINNIITQRFADDEEREKVFLWNYSGMNLGFFVGISVCGYFQITHNYRMMFIFGFICAVAAGLFVLLFWKNFQDVKTEALKKVGRAKLYSSLKVYLILAVVFLVLLFLINYAELCSFIVFVSLLLVLAFILYLIVTLNRADSNRMFVFLVLLIAALIFWSIFQLVPIGLNLFIAYNVNLTAGGFHIMPQWVINLNTIIIIVGGPLLGRFFQSLRDRGINLTVPFQFSLALLLIGIAYMFLPIGILFADKSGHVSFLWIVNCYILQSIGELLVAPVAFSMIGKLVPARFQSLMMGVWIMLIGIGSVIAGYISKFATVGSLSDNPLVTNPGYMKTFGTIGTIALLFGIILLLAKNRLNKMLPTD